MSEQKILNNISYFCAMLKWVNPRRDFVVIFVACLMLWILKAELKKKFLEEELPKSLEKLEKLLKDNDGGDGFFVGDVVYAVHVWPFDQRRLSSVIDFNPLTPTVAIMGTAVKHPVPDRVKPSFVIFDIWALQRSALVGFTLPEVKRGWRMERD